jgi:ribosomal protein L11 methyltransferase
VPAGLEESRAGELVELAVYVDEADASELLLDYPGAISVVVPDGWADRWRDFHRATWAGGMWIGPPWLEPPAGARTVVVDPGRAFGTGAHPTTRACIDALATLPRGSLLDAGCGSGVVAVAAAVLGFAPVHAVDVDAVAVEVARATAASNAVAVDVEVTDVVRDDLPSADVVVANIELGIVDALLARLDARLAVTSGYGVSEKPSATGWNHLRRVELDGWAADVLEAG